MKPLKTLVTAQTPAELLTMMGQDAFRTARTPSDWLNGCWELCSGKYEACVDMVLDSRRRTGPLFKLYEHGSSVQYILFRGSHPPANFDMPIANASTQWVVGVFSIGADEFVGGMLVGTFVEALHVWCKPNKHKLDIAFAEFVSGLGPSALTRIKSKLQEQMLEELDGLDREYAARQASTRGRYRNRLNYFTSLHDDAQDKLDKKENATYTFELSGYPLSREYASYKEARRAHSKRNVPNVECVITRKAKRTKGTMHTQTFARWSTADRVWNLL